MLQHRTVSTTGTSTPQGNRILVRLLALADIGVSMWKYRSMTATLIEAETVEGHTERDQIVE